MAAQEGLEKNHPDPPNVEVFQLFRIYLLVHLELTHLQWGHLVHLELVWECSAQC